MLSWFESSLIFPAPPLDHGNWNPTQFGAKEFFVPNGDTKIHAWHFLKEQADTTLIFCHGNGETIGTLGAEMVDLRDTWNVNVVVFDYRGYGKTQGAPNEQNILSDARSIANSLHEQFHESSQKFIVLGRSLGGALAIEIACHSKIDALILDRTFSSLVDVAAQRYFIFPVRLVMKNPFRSMDKITRYSGPLLQVHGESDELVPIQFGRKLFQACPSHSKRWITVPKMKHNDSWPESVSIEVGKFVASIGVAK